MAADSDFGKRLRVLRRRNPNDITLADVADHLGCSVAYVSAIERGKRNPPSNERIRSLLQFLGEESVTDEMIELAVLARKSVEIPIDGKNPKLTSLLLGLARRTESGGLKGGDPLLDEITRLLEENEDGLG